MSKDMFNLPEDQVNSRRNSTYQLQGNVFEGFKQAIRNGQTVMALEYLEHVIDVIKNRFDELDAQLDRASTAQTPAKPAPAKKAASTDTPVATEAD